jgi:hypothetical protein
MASYIMTVSIPTPRPDFRDIRSDLRARINSLEVASEQEQAEFIRKQERAAAEHRKVMESFKSALDGYRRLLDLEEVMAEKNMLGTVTQLKEKGPLTKDQLRLAAMFAGYFVDGDSGGRATHATLSNIYRSGRIGTTEGGKYFAMQAEEKPLL